MKKYGFILIGIIALILLGIITLGKFGANRKFVFYNGNVFTALESDTKPTAVAIDNGRIIFVGDDESALKLAKFGVKKIDLKGNTLMPGIVDAHMHPQSAGLKMQMCNLEYLPLTMAQMNQEIQKCLDDEKDAKPDDWLVVINWFEQEMQPIGFAPIYKDLDSLKTTRPVYVKNSFGHAAILNSRAMEIVDLANQKDRAGGVIVRDKSGNPTGRLEDAARDIVSEKLPQPDSKTNLKAAQMAQEKMIQNGITTILDAYTDIETMSAYKELKRAGNLKIRPNFAVLIDPDKEPDNQKSVSEVILQRALFDEGTTKIEPSLSVHTAKIFLDGTIALPSLTGNMAAPYWENKGTKKAPNWQASRNYGPKIYVSHEKLTDIITKLENAGIDTHIHADGDGAVNHALNATEAAQKANPNFSRRTAIAHCEIVLPSDYSRFAKLGVLPVLSFQWGKPAADTWEGTKNILGQARHEIIEPQGLLANAGAKIVFGSDWPVDPLNEFLALEVAVTRMAHGEDTKKYPMRLGIDPGLSLNAALKAMTINAAFSLHMEKYIGSIEEGKFADLIILDRNLFASKPEDISNTKVIMTVVGGNIVYSKPH